MATHDYILSNQSGSSFRSDLNNALAAIVSSNSSATEPATPYAYQYWIDSSATPELLKQRNSTNDGWITLAEINGQTLVSDGTEAKPGIAFASDINTGLRRSAADTLEIVTAGVDAITVDSTGQVGVGRVPGYSFDVEGSSRVLSETTGGNVFILANHADATTASRLKLRKARGAGATPSQITAGDVLGEIFFEGYDGAVYSDGFKIECTTTTNTGNFAPETVITSNGTARLTFRSGGDTNCNSNLWSNGTPAIGSNGYYLAISGIHKFARSAGASSNIFQVFGNLGEFRIKGDGDAQNTNNNYGSISDIKLKENIVDANSQWDDIKAIQVRNYNYKSDTPYSSHTQIGVIAQELETVCPGLVKDTTDEDADGNDLGTVTRTVSYSVLYMKAVKALQEAMTRIEELETKVAALEAAN